MSVVDVSKSPLQAIREILLPGFRAFRAYWQLFLAIQVLAFIFVVAFHRFDAVKDAVAWIRNLQASGPILFAAITNVFSGAVIPELVKLKFRAAVEKPITWGDFVFRCVFMALCGLMVHSFYLVQDFLFGSGFDPQTLLKKLLFDQLFFSPFIAMPFVVGMFLLHENRYNPLTVIKLATPKTYYERVLPLWTTALSFWPLMLLIIYALPIDMQFILFLFANTAFCLVMMLVASNGWEEESAQ